MSRGQVFLGYFVWGDKIRGGQKILLHLYFRAGGRYFMGAPKFYDSGTGCILALLATKMKLATIACIEISLCTELTATFDPVLGFKG